MKCNICSNQAEWVENKELYGKNYGKSYMMWLCRSCGAYVSCHNNTKNPMGTLADNETREWRKKVHSTIDPIWRSGKVSRGKLYRFIKKELKLNNAHHYHTGYASIEDCKKVLAIDFNLLTPTQSE